jgi:hypothetical protein
MSESERRNIFISHAADDRQFAEELRQALTLTDQSVDVFDPYSDTKVGEDRSAVIEEKIRDSDVFVYIVAGKAGLGKSSLFEVGAAKALGKRIVAVLPNSARVANTEVAARLADDLVLDAESKPTSEIVKKILEKAA